MFNILKNYLKKQKLKKLLKASKLQKLVANLHDKTEYVIDIKNLKEALNHWLVLEKVHGVFKFNQKTWLKSHIDMNTELRKNGYNNFEKNAFKLINNTVFTKTMENVRKHRDIKLVTTEARRNYLVSERNYQTTISFSENLLAMERKKHTQLFSNKPIHIAVSI